MLHSPVTAGQRRQAFRNGLASGRLMRFPGAFNPLSVLLIERLGFEGIYVSGADMIFPEALAGAEEISRFRQAVDAPVLANMTEFGKTELLGTATLASLGVNVVIYPVTLLRLAMGAAERGLRVIASEGTQKGLLGQMQSRAELYDLIGYDGYTKFDAEVGGE